MNNPIEPVSREELIAEHLTGELTPDRRALFEAMLRDDPAIAMDIRDMTRTVHLMMGLDPACAPPSTPNCAKRVALGSAMRRAAIIALAFVSGVVARGVTGPQPSTHVASADDPAHAVKAASPNWEQRAAIAYANAPGGNSLGKSLMALMQTADSTHR